MSSQSNTAARTGEAAHTPTPYEAVTNLHRKFVRARDKRMGVVIFVAETGEGPEAEANAAFIVRACNSHAALVEALEAARIDVLARAANMARPLAARLDSRDRLRDLDAALAQAKGGAS